MNEQELLDIRSCILKLIRAVVEDETECEAQTDAILAKLKALGWKSPEVVKELQKKLDDWQAGFEHFLSMNLELTQKIIKTHTDKMVEWDREKVADFILRKIFDIGGAGAIDRAGDLADQLHEELTGGE